MHKLIIIHVPFRANGGWEKAILPSGLARGKAYSLGLAG
jgi:hypothetical protein